MNRRLAALLALVMAGLLTLAACNNSTGGSGEPTSGSTDQSQGNTDGSGSSSSTSNSASGTKSLKPCSLLTPAEISQNGLGPGKLEHNNRSCNWDNNDAVNGAGYSIEVDIRDNLSYDDLNQQIFTVTDDPINGRQAKQAKDINGSGCTVTMRVTKSSSVDINTDAGNGDADLSCQYANQFAKLVEPKLPGGGN